GKSASTFRHQTEARPPRCPFRSRGCSCSTLPNPIEQSTHAVSAHDRHESEQHGDPKMVAVARMQAEQRQNDFLREHGDDKPDRSGCDSLNSAHFAGLPDRGALLSKVLQRKLALDLQAHRVKLQHAVRPSLPLLSASTYISRLQTSIQI